MPIQKIKSGRVSSLPSDEFVGSHGIIFYDESKGDLRLSDGITPGGLPLITGRAQLSESLPTEGVDPGELYFDINTSITYISNADNEWVPIGGSGPAAYILPKASTTVLGGIKLGPGLTINASGVVDVTVPPLELFTTPQMVVTNNRCQLPKMPIGDFVYNIAIVYTDLNIIEEHNNISLYVDANSTPFLVFNDSEITNGDMAVVTYAVVI